MVSRLMSTPETPRKPLPSTKNEKVFPKSSGASGGDGGAGSCATATLVVKIIAARRLSTCLAFIAMSSGRVCVLHAALRWRFQKVFLLAWYRSDEVAGPLTLVYRAPPVPLTPARSFLHYARGRDARPIPTRRETGARHPHRETSSAPHPTPSHHSYSRSQSPALAFAAPPENTGKTTLQSHSPDRHDRRNRASDDANAAALN